MADSDFPGTAEERRSNVENAARGLDGRLDGDWASVRVNLLEACGLRNMNDVMPGQGRTSHCFGDFNHVDCCTMKAEEKDRTNDGRVLGMHPTNALGDGIAAASDPEKGAGGSWCTCHINSAQKKDVCHVQFGSRIGFKLVWCKSADYKEFTLVDDDGRQLARGKPEGALPPLSEREQNYRVVEGSMYAKACDE